MGTPNYFKVAFRMKINNLKIFIISQIVIVYSYYRMYFLVLTMCSMIRVSGIQYYYLYHNKIYYKIRNHIGIWIYIILVP